MMRLPVLCLLTALAIGGGPALAYEVSPLIVDLAPSGPGASGEIRVRNVNPQAITLEVEVLRRTVDEQGVETTVPGDDDLIVLPPQFIVEPGRTQVLRLRYVGEPSLAASLNYSALIKQVPVALPGEASGVAVVVNFAVAVNVVPPGATAEIAVADLSRRGNSVEATLVNSGAAYASLAQARWVFRNGRGEEFAADGGALRDQIGIVLLQANSRRSVRLTLPAGFADDGITLQVIPGAATR